jgi:hypothetical protein
MSSLPKSVSESDGFYSACLNGDVEKVKQYLPNITSTDIERIHEPDGNTALHAAASKDHIEIVRLLLEKNPVLTTLNKDRKTAYEIATNDKVKSLLNVSRNDNKEYFIGDCSVDWMCVDKNKDQDILMKALIYRHKVKAFSVSARDIMTNYIEIELKKYKLDSIREIYDKAEDQNGPEWVVRAYTDPCEFYKILNQELALTPIDGALAKSLRSLTSTDWEDWTRYRIGVGSIVHIIACHPKLDQYTYTGETYRGLSMTEKDERTYVRDSIVMNKSFSSSSKSPKIAHDFLQTDTHKRPTEICALCIYNIKNKRTAIYIKNLSQLPHEEEVLIMPYSAFRVVNVSVISNATKNQPKVIEIRLDELDESAYPTFNSQNMDADDRDFLKGAFIPALRNNEL